MSFQYLCDENRLGKFRVHVTHLFEDYVREFFKSCIIVKAERSFIHGDTIDYIAFHPDFSQLPEGLEAPLYQIFLDSSGKIDISHTASSEGFPSDWIRLGRHRKC